MALGREKLLGGAVARPLAARAQHVGCSRTSWKRDPEADQF
jgi:hypothetical protein